MTITLRLFEGGPREIHENIHRCIDDVSFLGFRILVVDKLLVGYQQQEFFTASCATIHPPHFFYFHSPHYKVSQQSHGTAVVVPM